ncbi:hypothetical protein [Bradyrhizobium sp. NAS80.1]|uniref:hypothetical protein n=1 Tax=Bradyrhizobium sp. NAS80.1 TaxID=1680159 RepID=UPI00143DC994|nr:hypothetical protein [Bradyrhizobium sp. NAS80.1]
MNIIRKLLSNKATPADAPPTSKKRRKLAKRCKKPLGAVRLDANAPIMDQLRSCL